MLLFCIHPVASSIGRPVSETLGVVGEKKFQKRFLDDLHQKRDALYEKVASLTVNSDDNALEKHIKEVVDAVTK